MDQRETYLEWFYNAMARTGGQSYVGFIDHMRRTAIEKIPEQEKDALAELVVEFSKPTIDLASLPQPVGPGENWMQGPVKRLGSDNLREEHPPRDYENGKKMFAAALCQSCHTMNGTGGNIGQDLSQIGTRFSRNDLIESIISPSHTISDQYAATLLRLNDGGTVVGRVVGQDEETMRVNQNPFDPSQVIEIAKSDVASEELSPVSIMPAGLMNRLNEDEVLDLLAYLLANGDAEHELFTDVAE